VELRSRVNHTAQVQIG